MRHTLFSLILTGKRNDAFTLIELLLSIVILVVGVVGVLLVIPVAQRSSKSAALTTRMTMVAEQTLEQLKTKGYETLIDEGTWEGSEDIYSWKAWVEPVTVDDFKSNPTLPSEGLIKIKLTIEYDYNGRKRSETFYSFYSEM